jgi:hypothetical protein
MEGAMRNLESKKARPNWQQHLARILVRIAQKLEPDLQTPSRSRKAKQ